MSNKVNFTVCIYVTRGMCAHTHTHIHCPLFLVVCLQRYPKALTYNGKCFLVNITPVLPCSKHNSKAMCLLVSIVATVIDWGNLSYSAVATGLEKVSFHSDPKERQSQRMLKLLTIALISHASKVMLKILQARLQQYVDHELPDVQGGFRKGRGIRDQIANIRWIIEKAREF